MEDNFIMNLVRNYRDGLITAEELVSILEKHLYAIIEK